MQQSSNDTLATTRRRLSATRLGLLDGPLEGQRWPACPQEILRPLASWCARAPPQGILMGSLLWATHVEVKSTAQSPVVGGACPILLMDVPWRGG